MIRKRISDQGSYTYTHPHLFKVTQVLLLIKGQNDIKDLDLWVKIFRKSN